MKNPPDFTKLDPTGAARSAINTNGLHSAAIVDRQCLFKSVHAYNGGASDRYVQLHDSRTLPSNGSKPLRVWALGPGQSLDHELIGGRPMAEGLCVAISSTAFPLTYTNADEIILDLTYSEL
jgi:hypothetical protein